MPQRVTKIENWNDIDEVRLFGGTLPRSAIATITKVDGQIEFHFPQSTTMTKEQAALVAAHIIAMITT